MLFLRIWASWKGSFLNSKKRLPSGNLPNILVGPHQTCLLGVYSDRYFPRSLGVVTLDVSERRLHENTSLVSLSMAKCVDTHPKDFWEL